MPNVNRRDLAAGLVILGIGLFFFIGAFEYRIGSLARMGSGLFPMALGLLTMGFGAVILVGAVGRKHVPVNVDWRPLLAVILGIGGFALAVDSLGLLPAVIASVAVSAVGDRSARLGSTVGITLVMCLIVYVVFVLALNLPVPAIRRYY